MRFLPLPLVVALLLLPGLAPSAQAEDDALAFSGALAFGSDVHLRGEGAVDAPDGVLDLLPAVLQDEAIGLTWGAARGYDVEAEWTLLRTGPESIKRRDEPVNDSIELPAGRLESVTCGPECEVALVGLGEGAAVGFRGHFDGSVRLLPGKRSFWAEYACPGSSDAFYHELPPGAFAAGGREGTPVFDAAPHASGRLGLFLRDAILRVATEEGPRELGTLHHAVPLGAPGVASVGARVRTGFVYLELEGAALSMAPGTAAVFLAPAPRLDLAGTLASRTTTGHLALDGGREIRLDREPLLLDGAVEARLDPPPAASDAGVCADPSMREPVENRPRPHLPASMRGEAKGLVVDGERVVGASSSAAPALVAGATALALLGALAWLLLERGALAPLYSRISPSRILANPRRQQIHDLLRGRPGATATELAEAAGLARVVVQHHLRMLETHGVATARQEGRRRAYFLVGGLPPAPVLQGQAALRDATRKRIAEALAASREPLTQGALVEGTGLSQRLVSYHLSHLEASGLVSAEGRLPRRYRPTALLGAALGEARQGAA